MSDGTAMDLGKPSESETDASAPTGESVSWRTPSASFPSTNKRNASPAAESRLTPRREVRVVIAPDPETHPSSEDTKSREPTPQNPTATRVGSKKPGKRALPTKPRKKGGSVARAVTSPHAASGRAVTSASGATSPKRGSRTGSPLPLRQHSRGGKGRRGQKAFHSLMNSEKKGRAEVEEEYGAGWKQIVQHIVLRSFEPQKRAILYLQETLRETIREYGGRAERAEDALAKLTQGMIHLAETVHESGASFLGDCPCLSTEVPFDKPDMTADVNILACAKDPSSNLQETHVPLKRRDSQEILEVEKIRSLFLDFKLLSADETALSISDTANLAENTAKLPCQIAELASTLKIFFQRAHRMIEHWGEKNRILQRALDERATRVKTSDDILRDTIVKRKEEVNSAIQVCGQVGTELRARMDAIEKYVKETLSELIERSTEVSIKNNAYHEHAQLVYNKENALQLFMSKMEMAVVEQGKLLRDVRLEILKLWKKRCGNGDKERATLKHSGLPAKYRAALDTCDRETLLRLLHFVSLNSVDASALLIGALDEYEHFMKDHSAEAQAIAQRTATETAVMALVEKLYDEGEIKLNPLYRGASLEETIYDMVRHYNIYMEAEEKKQRHALRKKALEESSVSRPFFDSRTPVPPEYAVDIATFRSTQTKQVGVYDGATDRKQPDGPTGTAQKSGLGLPVVSEQDKNDGTSMALPRIENSQILRYLRRSHPSEMDPPGTASVVGFGRWGGKMAQRRVGNGARNGSTEAAVLETADVEIGPQRSAVKKPNPPPGVPPRLTVVRHMLEDHSGNLETISLNANAQQRCFHGEDESFLKLQRDLFEMAS